MVYSLSATPAIVAVTVVAGLAGCAIPRSRDIAARSPTRTGFLPSEIDFGSVPWHSSQDFAIEFLNAESSSITIAALKATCACTGFDPAAYVGRTISPGDSIEIVGKLDTGERLGSRKAELELMLDSGTIYWLALKYQGYATYTCMPDSVAFQAVDLDDEEDQSDCTQTISFRSADVVVTAVDPQASWLEAGVYDTGPSDTPIWVHVVKTRLPHGKNVGLVNVTTSDPFRPQFSVRVTANGVSKLRALPGHVVLRPNQEARVMFVRSDGTLAQLTAIQPDSNDIRAVIQPQRASVLIAANEDSAADNKTRVVRVTDANGYVTRVLVTVIR